MTEPGSGAERAYTWAVRALYVVGIAANLWLVWDQYRDTPEGRIFEARARKVVDPVVRELKRERELQRMARHVIFEAWQVVDPPGSKVGTNMEGGDDGAE